LRLRKGKLTKKNYVVFVWREVSTVSVSRVYNLWKKNFVNVADNPPLCDFYIGGIVTKGNLKVAISTNGKSPTLAKRIRQWLEGFLPGETDALLDKLYVYRNSLKGDFEQKIEAMNILTEKLLEQHD